MAGTVTLPGGKKVSKLVAGGVLAGGLGAAYLVYRARKGSASASSATSATGMVTDPSSGVQYPANGDDPVTGETYAQEIGQYGSVEAADQAAQSGESSYLGDSGDLYGTGYNASDYSTGTYGADTTVSGSIYTSNSAWSQAATAGLEDIGYTGTDVAAALGLYLTGMPLTSDQASIVQAALAEYGNPPSGSFQVITQPSGNTTSASTVAVPNVTGDSLSAAQSAISSAGLVYSGPHGAATDDGKAPASSQSPAAGTQVHPGTTVTVTTSYTAPSPAAQKYGVPRVAGESAATAHNHLIADGFQTDSGGLAGNVIVTGTSPAAGTMVPHGTTVTLQGNPKNTVPKTAST